MDEHEARAVAESLRRVSPTVSKLLEWLVAAVTELHTRVQALETQCERDKNAKAEE